MSPGSRPFIHIAAGCIENQRGEILVCQRPAHKIYPGEWEFPGGKVEPGETAEQALRRELHEELGIQVLSCRPLIRLRHVYPELSVDLDVWRVGAYSGALRSIEHPEIAWVVPDALPGWKLLAADRPIVSALRLPSQMVITPPDLDPGSVAGLAAHRVPSLVRLRVPRWSDRQYRDRVRELAPLVRAAGHRLVTDREPARVAAGEADGFHATSRVLAGLEARPVPDDAWFGASCHEARELERARAVRADYVLLGPVRQTPSHPGTKPLGWEGFARLAGAAGLPVFAVGGLGPHDLGRARAHGAHGIAGISAFAEPDRR